MAALINKPPDGPVTSSDGSRGPGWPKFFSDCFVLLSGMTQSGPTASRPTQMLWVGRPYFDTSLGAQGKLISVCKDGVRWVDGSGAIV